MTHRFEGHPSVADTCLHRFVDDTGYEYICGEASLAPVHTVKPVGGYADGTSGHSGTETSEARVRKDDANGVTAQRQVEVLRYMLVPSHHRPRVGPVYAGGGPNGLTYRELCAVSGFEHQHASAALTNLHKAGKIARLTEVRFGCKVYVLPEYVGDRETEAYASRLARPALPPDHVLEAMRAGMAVLTDEDYAVGIEWLAYYAKAGAQ